MMNFSIPYPVNGFDPKIVEKYDEVSEVYLKGPTSTIGSARIHAFSPSISDFKNLCKDMHDIDLDVNVVINSTCLGGCQFDKEWMKSTLKSLDQLVSSDVDIVTVADPYLIELIKHYGYHFKICVSVLSFVNTPVKAWHFYEMGVDRITLPPDVNRRLDTIKEIRNTVECDLAIIVNEGCLFECPFRYFCYNFISHNSLTSSGSVPVKFKDGRIVFKKTLPPYFYFADRLRIRTHPHLLLTSPWVRPENLGDYEKLGIGYIKISGREKPDSFLAQCLKAYSSRSYDGNIFEIIDGTPRMASREWPTYGAPFYYLDNKKLDGFFKKVGTCSKNCNTCGFCEEFAKEHLKANKAVPEVYRELQGVYPWYDRENLMETRSKFFMRFK